MFCLQADETAVRLDIDISSMVNGDGKKGWDVTERQPRTMLTSMLAAAVALAGCGGSEPPDECEYARENLDQCLLVNRAATALEIINKCVPVSDLQRIDGTWAFDLGLNAFYEGEVLEPEVARDPPPGTVELIYEGSQLEEYVVGELATVVDVGFYGRRPACGFEQQFPYLVVERVASRNIIEQYRSPLFPEKVDAPKNLGHVDPFDRQDTAP